MRSHILMLCISSITFNISGMLGPQLPPMPQCPQVHYPNQYQATIKHPGKSLKAVNTDHTRVLRIKDSRTAPEHCAQSLPAQPQHPVLQAVEQGDSNPVIEHFNSWQHWIRPWHYYAHDVAVTLDYATRFPAQKTGDIVAFLLPKVALADQDETIDASCLLKHAITNGHSSVIKHLNAQLPELVRLELMDAVLGNKPDHLKSLLAAGVDPNSGVGEHLPRIRMSDDASNSHTLEQNLSYKELICFFGGAWCCGLITNITMHWHQLKKELLETK